MRIEAYYDILCPFSFLAKRYLDLCLKEFPDVPVDIELKPFMLQPGLPLGPHDFRGVFTAKYGEGARVPMWDRVIALGEEVDIAFAFYRMTLGAHSVHGHRAVRFAHRHGKARAVLEGLYRAFYEEARYIGDVGTLAAIGAQAGVPAAPLRAYLESDQDVALIFQLTEQYRADPGVNGMPFHVVDGRVFRPEAGLSAWRGLFEHARALKAPGSAPVRPHLSGG